MQWCVQIETHRDLIEGDYGEKIRSHSTYQYLDVDSKAEAVKIAGALEHAIRRGTVEAGVRVRSIRGKVFLTIEALEEIAAEYRDSLAA